MLNKNSLIVDIKAAAQVINGKVPNVRDTNFGSDFSSARYAIILLAALMSPIFEDNNIQIQNFTCVNFYRLKKVARLLGLVFDRTRTAEKIYRNLESKQRIIFFKVGNKTFITFTKQGQKMSLERLKQFIYLQSIASLQNQQAEERQGLGTSLAIGVKIKPHETKNAKLIANELG